MTTQEAYTREIKPKQDDRNKNERTILIFPNLHSSIFAIFTGDENVVRTFTNTTSEFKQLKNEYDVGRSDRNIADVCPINVVMTSKVVQMYYVVDKEQILYYEYDYVKDSAILNVIADALNALISSCLRTLPKLIQNENQCRNITQITENPLYDSIVFVYSLFHRLDRAEVLLKSYLQHILSTKQTTYVTMCQNTSYITELSGVLTEYYVSGEFLKDVPSLKFSEDTQRYEEVPDTVEYVAIIANYCGQKKKSRLFLRSGPKREILTSNRYMATGVSDTIV